MLRLNKQLSHNIHIFLHQIIIWLCLYVQPFQSTHTYKDHLKLLGKCRRENVNCECSVDFFFFFSIIADWVLWCYWLFIFLWRSLFRRRAAEKKRPQNGNCHVIKYLEIYKSKQIESTLMMLALSFSLCVCVVIVIMKIDDLAINICCHKYIFCCAKIWQQVYV